MLDLTPALLLMNTKQKIAAGLVAFLLLLPLIWYALAYLPYAGLIRTLATQGSSSIQGANPLLQPLVLADQTPAQVRSYAMRQAYASLVFENHRGSASSWQANNALWYLASYLHFQDSEMLGLWAQCAFGCGHGLKEASLQYLHKDVHRLSKREAANLVAAVKSPVRYLPGSIANERRTDELLMRLRVQK
jgi:hypothetical protein